MADYYVNKNQQSNGDHEVHKTGCDYFPNQENAVFLGSFTSCHYAVSAAKKKGYNANGCYYYSKECYTT